MTTELPTPANPSGWRFETRQIQAYQVPDATTGARALPIYQTSSYVFPDAKTAANRFALQELGPIYSRLTNPTQEVVESRIADLEGGVGGLLVASGSAALNYAILNVARAGDAIVSSPSLYGGSFNLLKYRLAEVGITTIFVEDPEDVTSWDAALTANPNVKAVFAETVPNPKHDILDVEAVAGVAHKHGVPLIVDNTVATPYVLRPIEYGADIVIHSATKYLGGHGNTIAGVIVDAGNFDYAAEPGKFPGFTEPDPSYNGLVYGEAFGPGGVFGVNLSFILKIRAQLLRDTGASISANSAFLVAQGLETLSLRVERHLANAQKVAEFLEARPEVNSVSYAGLPSSPYHELAAKYTPAGPGAVLGFVLDGGADAGQTFVEALSLFSNVANIGDVRSLAIHPASTTHSQLSEEEQHVAGVDPGFVRLSIGIEHIDDILADLENAFSAVARSASVEQPAAV